MFGDVNKVILMGNVTNDPDLRYTTGGTAVLNFGLATNRRYKKGEEWVDEPSFHNIVVWRSAEGLGKRIKKGTRLYLEGYVHTRSWESDGEKKYKTEVTADTVNLIARYEGSNDGGGGSAAPSSSGSSNGGEDVDPDDLPF